MAAAAVVVVASLAQQGLPLHPRQDAAAGAAAGGPDPAVRGSRAFVRL